MDPDWKIVVSQNLDHYRSFFESTWHDEITRIAAQTTFADATFSLTLSFYGQSQARAMPVTMFEILNMMLSETLQRQQEFPASVVENYIKIVHEENELNTEQLRKARLRFMQLFEPSMKFLLGSFQKILRNFGIKLLRTKLLAPVFTALN